LSGPRPPTRAWRAGPALPTCTSPIRWWASGPNLGPIGGKTGPNRTSLDRRSARASRVKRDLKSTAITGGGGPDAPDSVGHSEWVYFSLRRSPRLRTSLHPICIGETGFLGQRQTSQNRLQARNGLRGGRTQPQKPANCRLLGRQPPTCNPCVSVRILCRLPSSDRQVNLTDAVREAAAIGGVSEKEGAKFVEYRAEQCRCWQRHNPGKNDVACHIPADSSDLAGSAHPDDRARDGVGSRNGDAEIGR
jgi:hypothetical protein